MLEFGKTIFTAILAKVTKDKKILLIDFDLKKHNLSSVFGSIKVPKEIKKKLQDEDFLLEFKLKEENLEKLIVKIDKNIDLISDTDIIFDKKYIINQEKLKSALEKLKQNYDLILIDSSEDTR